VKECPCSVFVSDELKYLAQALFADRRDLGLLSGKADGDEDEGALILRPIEDLAEKSHRAWGVGEGREAGEVEMEQVEAALESLKYRHLEALQRRVRADIAEAERRGDLAQLAVFMAQKLKVDRQMRDADA